MQPALPGQWLLAVWPSRQAQDLVDPIREGCVRGRYWLRAYAALPDRLAVLLYPLEEPAELLAYFGSLTGHAPEKLRAIKSDAELERAARFVESLPVRSRLAIRPEEYPWSNIGWMPAVSVRASSRPRGLDRL